MKRIKLILPMIMVFAICLGTIANAAVYSYFPDVPDDSEYAQAVNVLAEMSIFQGDDAGNFNPHSTITRAEFATIMARVLGEESRALTIKTSKFTDLPSTHWACGYVAVAVEYGLVNGYGDGRFGPTDTLTYEQAVKVLVCFLGYESHALENGGWPNGYILVANELGLLDNTDSSNASATRSTVAILVYNTIHKGTGGEDYYLKDQMD